uniref:MPV17 mitochondrial inner membrane protein like n=1 Tax=Nomascus leucogenys TaxID=61853 RepID=A0A2I3HJV7_NOMLE
MAGWWPALPRAAWLHPWPTNVLLYGSLLSAGDALQQRLQSGEADWRQTRRLATLVVTFHANFNYVWLGLPERAKLLCDQVVGAPIAVSAFYVGILIKLLLFFFKFQSGLIYWPFVQLNNFSLVPVQWRTAYTGVCGFLWATFICFSQQSGDGTFKSAFTILYTKGTSPIEGSPEK